MTTVPTAQPGGKGPSIASPDAFSMAMIIIGVHRRAGDMTANRKIDGRRLLKAAGHPDPDVLPRVDSIRHAQRPPPSIVAPQEPQM